MVQGVTLTHAVSHYPGEKWFLRQCTPFHSTAELPAQQPSVFVCRQLLLFLLDVLTGGTQHENTFTTGW